MVGDHAQRGRGQILGADRRGHVRDQALEQVDLVVAVHVLEHGGDPLEPHAGVHARLRQRGQRAVGGTLELHEDEVPDLDVAVPVLLRRAGRPAGDLGAVVVEDLRARPAGPGIAHRPEVVLRADADDPLGGHADVLDPNAFRFVVLLEDGDPELLLRQAELFGQERPGEADRLRLEVVAEAEVAQHLEEGVVAGGVADVVEIVVLAARAHAALRGGRPHVVARLLPGEQLLERHHAGVGEQQRLVVAGHERGGGHTGVPALDEVGEKALADLGSGDHGRNGAAADEGTAHCSD